jgi:starch synthase
MRPLRLALAASEVAPFAKTGGLADVLLGLGRWLGQKGPKGPGHDVRLFLPFYRRIQKSDLKTTPLPGAQAIDVRFPNRTIRFSIRTAPLPQSEVPVYFVDCNELYDREGIYTEDGDEALRFGFLSRAVLETCQRLQWAPDVDPLQRLAHRPAAALPAHHLRLGQAVRPHEDAAVDPQHRLPGLLQGQRARRARARRTARARAPRRPARRQAVVPEDRRPARDALGTVSRTYAREIQTAEYGMGMEELLRSRSQDLVGIVNGVDYGEWNPKNDPRSRTTSTPRT